jgi:Fumarylacetoacetate (FAA) hydrolase family
MFHPDDLPMERGWVGRIDGEHVVHLAAQTLESFFTGGGSAREHAVYPLEAVRLLAPVLHPPSVRLFDDEETFAFANPAAIVGPDAAVRVPRGSEPQGGLVLLPRIAGVVGARGTIGGFTLLAEWRDPERSAPKDRDFALGLGPVVATPDELEPRTVTVGVRTNGSEVAGEALDGFDWSRARELAAEGTALRPGDLLASPALASVPVLPGNIEIDASAIGVLEQRVGRR